jgi:two-component system, response regulator PdtaR
MRKQDPSLRILVVEDDAAIRRLTSYALRNAGFEVLEARTADEGATRIADAEIDALITDVEMPGTLNGYDLAWQAHTRHPAVPVLVVSGSIHSDRQNLPPGARFFDKPVDPWVLVAQVHSALLATRACPRSAA